MSMLGTAVSSVAIPIAAVVSLRASPAEMGILSALGTFPDLLFRLPAGVFADRTRRGASILILCDALRASLLAGVVVLSVFHVLTFWALLGIVALSSSITALFQTLGAPFILRLAPNVDLARRNGILGTANAIARVAGPTLAAGLIAIVGPLKSVAVDALSFLVSALALIKIYSLIREPKEPIEPTDSAAGGTAPRGWGLAALFGIRDLRSPLVSSGIITGANGAIAAILVLYLVRDVHLSATTVALLFAFGSAGGVVGAASSSKIASRMDVRILPALLLGALSLSLDALVIPAQDNIVGLIPVAMYEFLGGGCAALFVLIVITEVQKHSDLRMIGRTMSALAVTVEVPAVIGSLAGGFFAEHIGFRSVIVWSAVIGTIGAAASICWSVYGKVRDPK